MSQENVKVMRRMYEARPDLYIDQERALEALGLRE
jgi:hypothetical protein